MHSNRYRQIVLHNWSMVSGINDNDHIYDKCILRYAFHHPCCIYVVCARGMWTHVSISIQPAERIVIAILTFFFMSSRTCVSQAETYTIQSLHHLGYWVFFEETFKFRWILLWKFSRFFTLHDVVSQVVFFFFVFYLSLFLAFCFVSVPFRDFPIYNTMFMNWYYGIFFLFSHGS